MLASCPFIQYNYACSGNYYADYLGKLEYHKVLEQQAARPLQDGVHVLFYGHSHLRQLASALVCRHLMACQRVRTYYGTTGLS